MSTDNDVKMMEVLSSKICHDLISPIGAIHNGLEILEEMGGDDSGDIMQLISSSAQQAGAKLQLFRMAYGAGGADDSIKPEDVHSAIEQYLAHEPRVNQEWDPYAELFPDERPAAFAKLLSAGLLLAIECLPKGGTVSVAATDGGVCIKAAGENASPKEHTNAALALENNEDTLSPKYIHAYVTGLLARQYSYEVTIQQETDEAHILLSAKGE